MSKKSKVTRKHSSRKPKDSGLTHSDHDEVDHFHAKKHQVLLEDNNEDLVDSDEIDYNPDTMLDIPEEGSDLEGEEEEEGEEEDGRDDDHNWGRGRKNYYSNDKDKEEEVKEAERLYDKKLSSLTLTDFGVKQANLDKKTVVVKSVSFESDSDSGELADRSEEKDGDDVEGELEKAVSQVKLVLQPFIDRVAKGDLPRSQGLSFLQTKYNLLLHYCINAVYYVKSRASGKPLPEDHPVIERLVKYRMLIEKTKPLEAKLKYQIDRLLNAASDPTVADSQEQVRPHTELIKREGADGSDAGHADEKDGKYRPPKLMHTEMSKKERAHSSRIQQDLQREELYDENAPEEEEVDPVRRVGSKSTKVTGTSDTLDTVEEDNFVRFQLSKKDKRRLEEESKIVDGLDDLNDMFDEFDRRRPKRKSADDDGADLTIKSKSLKQKPPSSESEIESGSDKEEYYERAKSERNAKRADALEKRQESRKVKFRDIDDIPAGQPRPASRSILANRGLTPSRSRDTKNPRVKQRKRFEKASKRLGSFKAVHRSTSGPYSGESTGIRTNISRSNKF